MEELCVKVRLTKRLYKSWDSYNRRQVWICKKLVKAIKERYETAEQISIKHSNGSIKDS
jgi:Mg2+ and Co2+ transporter CorA